MVSDFGSLMLPVKLIGKLQDGAIFLKKGHDEEEPFEFKTDEGKIRIFLLIFSH